MCIRDRPELTLTGAAETGARAFTEAGITPADIDYASIYDLSLIHI